MLHKRRLSPRIIKTFVKTSDSGYIFDNHANIMKFSTCSGKKRPFCMCNLHRSPEYSPSFNQDPESSLYGLSSG